MKTILHVALNGDDANPGTASAPLATLAGARDTIRRLRRSRAVPVQVVVHAGTHYLREPLVLTVEDSGIAYEAAPGERVTLSGGRRLVGDWKPFRDGILMCPVPAGLEFTQLFINGKRQVRARFPNHSHWGQLSTVGFR